MASQTIAQRRKRVEEDLAAVEPALADARDSVKSIKKAHLDEVRQMGSPPSAVKLTLEAVVCVLGRATTVWKEIRRQLSKSDFIATVVNFQTSQVTPKIVKLVKSTYMDNPDFK